MASFLDRVMGNFGYVPKPTPVVQQPDTVEKADREGIAYNPLAAAYQAMNQQYGLRKPNQITFSTLRRMAASNWVDRTCINTLRDEISGSVPWDITPVDPKSYYDKKFQEYIMELLRRPNKNNENWRTFIDKIIEDILVVDAGTFEKVRDSSGLITELYHVDGATIKPCYDEHGMIGEPAYQQYLPNRNLDKPVAEWNNEDLVYIMWNPQGSIDNFGFGQSPVESGLAVGTAFLHAEAYNLMFFKNNTIPPMIINMGKEVPPAEIDKFRSFLAAEMQGLQGFHAPVIASFNEGFKVENLLAKPNDMAWEKYVEWQMRWKVALYRMSPQDIGFTLDQYKVEGETQLQLSKNKAINSLKNVIKQYLDSEVLHDVALDKYATNLQFDWVDTDVVDPVDQANVDKVYLQTGVKSINDIRQRDGLDPIVGGMQPTITLGSTLVKVDATEMMDNGDGDLLPVGKSLTVEKVLPKGQKNYEWQSTQLDLPDDIATKVKAFANTIPASELNNAQGGREPETHITVVYGLDTYLSPAALGTFTNQEAPIEVTLGVVSMFEQNDYDVLKINVESAGLHRLYEKIINQIGAPGATFPHYSPHVTIAYLKKGMGKKYDGDTRFRGTKITFNELSFSNQHGQKVTLSFSQDSDVAKVFSFGEGEIVPLNNNFNAVCWMDDRGVTQPLFVTDREKTVGFTIKSSMLDDRKDQDPPEAEVANILRGMKANTPEVQIMNEQQVLQLLPTNMYSYWTNWLQLKPPFDSMDWRRRWNNDSRKSNYYIVTGFITGTDLGDKQLQEQMRAAPEAYGNAVRDLAKIWIAERLYYLGDRKPGHYIITRQGNGFGVDYQFFKDQHSWEKTNGYLPKTLLLIHPALKKLFDEEVEKAAKEFGANDMMQFTEKAFLAHRPDDWERMAGQEDVEKKFAIELQRGIANFYAKTVQVAQMAKPVIVQKAKNFDPKQDYVTDGKYVYQGGVKYPMTVLPANKRPSKNDIVLGATSYSAAFNLGAADARLLIEPKINEYNVPDVKLSNPEMYAPMFNERANLVTDSIYNTMMENVHDAIVRGLDQGRGYAEIADMIQNALGIDPNNPMTPKWRAERIARTESVWAISEGMRQQYQQAGIRQVNVSPASSACLLCQDVASGNPYQVGEAGDLVPIHPNCRCVLVGDYAQFGSSKVSNMIADRMGQ